MRLPPLRRIRRKTVMTVDLPDPALDRAELDQLFNAAYDELRRLASAVRRRDSHATITPTALVNEAWLKLANTPRLGRVSPLHFRRIAARAMRQVLVEAARRRTAGKRGGARAVLVTFDDDIHDAASTADELLALDEALKSLAQHSPRQAAMVESRFFGGLGVAGLAGRPG